MDSSLLTPLASCRTYGELAQVLVLSGLYNHDFTGCLIAEIAEDGRIREAGRYGMIGPGPLQESLPLWDDGLIARAMKKSTPTVIENTIEAAQTRSLTPSGDIDELVVLNGFQTLVAMPLRSFGLLNGVVGLASVSRPSGELMLNYDYKNFQALMTLATRAVAYSQPAVRYDQTPLLTVRDRAILAAISKGFTNNEIVAELKLSLPTIKLAVSNLLAKLSVSTRQAAVERAHHLGLLQ